LLLKVMATLSIDIEQRVEGKKQELLRYNAWARSNPSLLQDKVFCLCTRCTAVPLMNRNCMTSRRTAYNHRQSDVSRKLITNEELLNANGSLTLVPYGDFFRMYRRFLVGAADESGLPCGLSNVQEQEQSIHDHSNEPERDMMDGDFSNVIREWPDTPFAPAGSPNAGGDVFAPPLLS